MNIEKELKGLAQNMNSDELLESILKTYSEEMTGQCYEVEKEYQEGKEKLSPVLTEKQKEDLEQMERLFAENQQYSLGWGMKRGIYAGFEQYFVEDSTEDAFNEFVFKELLMMPNMQKYKEHYDRKNEINSLFESIRKDLGTEDAENLTVVYSTYEEKQLGILRYSFYIGYRYALSVIEDTVPLGAAGVKEKILYTEQELGFIKMGKEMAS